MFVDKVNVRVSSGNGGQGCLSFRREKFRPKGGPDGGDGGDGGNVIFVASNDLQTLLPLRYLNHYEAENGQHGQGNDKHGRVGADAIVKVPVGTVFRDLDDPAKPIVADLDAAGKQFFAARGGKGGKGNARFATSTNQAPRQVKESTPGDDRYLELELKLLADAGLVGYPNAGKSTLLGAISNATPATAAYPFTTLEPTVGIVEFSDFYRLTIADIPGLIDGAHRNVGLGHAFLRHIERTSVLLYVLDMAGTDGRRPEDDLRALQQELEHYQPGMTGRPSLIIANKMDEPAAAEALVRLRTHVALEIFPVCAELGDGLQPLLDKLRQLFTALEGGIARRKG